MTEPKFQIGQAVAVCTPGLTWVIPRTTVEDRMYLNGLFKGRPCKVGWHYVVAGASCSFDEPCLRPLHDDDYTEETESEKEASK